MTADDWCSRARGGGGGGAMARAWAHGACESETRGQRAEESAAMCAESAELAWCNESGVREAEHTSHRTTHEGSGSGVFYVGCCVIGRIWYLQGGRG